MLSLLIAYLFVVAMLCFWCVGCSLFVVCCYLLCVFVLSVFYMLFLVVADRCLLFVVLISCHMVCRDVFVNLVGVVV